MMADEVARLVVDRLCDDDDDDDDDEGGGGGCSSPNPKHCLVVVAHRTPDDPMALRLTIVPTLSARRRVVVESVPALQHDGDDGDDDGDGEEDGDFGYVFQPFEIQLPSPAKDESVAAPSSTSGSGIPVDVVDDLVQVLLGRWDYRSDDNGGFPGWSILLCQVEPESRGGGGDEGGRRRRRRRQGGGTNNNAITPLLFRDVRPICTWNLPLQFADDPDDVELKLHTRLSQSLKLLSNIKKMKKKKKK